MFDLHLVPSDMRRIDELRLDAMCFPFFEDERPLRGTLGLVDWRLTGQLSRVLLRGRARGTLGERVLVPGRPRLMVEKLFLFGAGRRRDFSDEVFSRVITDVMSTLDDCRARSALLTLPGRALGLVDAERAMELFLGATRGKHEQDEITLVEDHDSQRVMLAVLEKFRRKVRSLDTE